LHGGQSSLDPVATRIGAHVGSKQHTGPDGFGEDQCVTGFQTSLADDGLRRGIAVDRQAEGHLGPFTRVPAGKNGPGFRKGLGGPRE